MDRFEDYKNAVGKYVEKCASLSNLYEDALSFLNPSGQPEKMLRYTLFLRDGTIKRLELEICRLEMRNIELRMYINRSKD